MSIANLNSILGLFKGKSATDADQVFKEVLLMTLARASRADSHVAKVEVDTIRSVMKTVSGEDISDADVRIAASSEIYETQSLESCLARVRDSLDIYARVTVVKALAEVIKSDVTVTDTEVTFFNNIADALKVSPAELAGLIP
jgi:uncharacterized tellurite resistance protein B-like protein